MATNKIKPEDSEKTKEILLRVEEVRTSIKQICASALTTPTTEAIVNDKVNGIIKQFTNFLKGYGTNYRELLKSSLNALKRLKEECLRQVKIVLKNTKNNEFANMMASSFFGNSKPNASNESKSSASNPQVQDVDKTKKTFVIGYDKMSIQEDLSVKFKETSGEYAYDQMIIQEYQEKVKKAIGNISNLALTEKTYQKVNGHYVGAPKFLSIRNKAEMTVRYEEMKEELKELVDKGEKFVIVSQHKDASKRCSPLQGLLYKLDVDPTEKVECVLNWRELGTRFPKQIGVIDGNPYYSLKEAMSYGLFSYNCRHRFIKYIPGMKVTEQYKYDDKLAEQKRNVDTKMRQMERAIRQAKERQVLSIDSKERRAYQIRSKQLQEKYIKFARKHNRVVNTWRCSISRAEQESIDLTKYLENGSMMMRKTNPNGLEHLPIVISKKSVRHVCKKYGLDLRDFGNVQMNTQSENLSAPFYAMTNQDGEIMLMPRAFTSERELITTLVHEQVHQQQYKKYDVKYVQNHSYELEQEALKAEKEFWRRYNEKMHIR